MRVRLVSASVLIVALFGTIAFRAVAVARRHADLSCLRSVPKTVCDDPGVLLSNQGVESVGKWCEMDPSATADLVRGLSADGKLDGRASESVLGKLEGGEMMRLQLYHTADDHVRVRAIYCGRDHVMNTDDDEVITAESTVPMAEAAL